MGYQDKEETGRVRTTTSEQMAIMRLLDEVLEKLPPLPGRKMCRYRPDQPVQSDADAAIEVAHRTADRHPTETVEGRVSRISSAIKRMRADEFGHLTASDGGAAKQSENLKVKKALKALRARQDVILGLLRMSPSYATYLSKADSEQDLREATAELDELGI